MEHHYTGLDAADEPPRSVGFDVVLDSSHSSLRLAIGGFARSKSFKVNLLSNDGRLVASQNMTWGQGMSFALPTLTAGVYYVAVFDKNQMVGAKKVWLNQR